MTLTSLQPPLVMSDGSILFGRDTLLTQLAAQLAGTRLLTLVGPGGVGKTRIARELIREHATYWVDLAPLAEAALLPQVIATACELKEQPGQSWTETLIAGLGNGDTLLVFDTCEHLRAACADLCATLLRASWSPSVSYNFVLPLISAKTMARFAVF